MTNNTTTEVITPQATQVTATVFYLEFSISTFSEFYVTIAAAPFPITISHISAKAKGESNLITWTTASESNNDVQIVESSADGISGWQEVDRVKGTNKRESVTYEVYDRKPLALTYYRIHSVDFDGQEQISKIVSVRRDGIKGGRINAIYPNLQHIS
ncbi:MAG: hypothetical protein IPL08_21080 [Saprospiraceae bacterium]|nr:hypothetical protein [Saprospiraceae bacterium]